MNFSRLASVALVVLSAGCGPERSTATTSQPIVGGTPEGPGSPVVLVRAVSGSRAGTCSGVFVGPRVVLTAGHCIAPGYHYSVFIGDDFRDTSQLDDPANTIDVSEAHAHPDYNPSTNDNDLGLLITTAPFGGTPATPNRAPLGSDLLGAPVRLVGYGQTTAGDVSTVGRRMQAATTIAQLDDTAIAFFGTPNFCLFDSGGPTFATLDGSEVVVGLHLLVDRVSCDGTSVDTRVDPLMVFVDTYLAKTSTPADGGIDAGLAPDAPADPADAGLADLGSDAGPESVPADAGPPARADAGLTGSDDRGPMGCSTTTNGGGWTAALLAFAALRFRRRPAQRRSASSGRFESQSSIGREKLISSRKR